MKTVTALLATAALVASEVSATQEFELDVYQRQEAIDNALSFRLTQDYGDEYGSEYGAEEEEEPAAEEDAGEEEEEAEEGAEDDTPFAEKTVAQIVEELDPLNQTKIWKWIDFSYGIVLGLWAPYMQRARDYDCFSEMMNLALEIQDWHLMFDQKFDMKDWQGWLFMGMGVLTQIYGGYRSLDVCLDQYYFSVGNPWYESMLAEPSVTAASKYKFRSEVKDGFDPLFDTVYLLSILGNGWDAYNAYQSSGRYMYHFGHNAALGTMRLVVFIDKIGADLISPSKPWVRYHD